MGEQPFHFIEIADRIAEHFGIELSEIKLTDDELVKKIVDERPPQYSTTTTLLMRSIMSRPEVEQQKTVASEAGENNNLLYHRSVAVESQQPREILYGADERYAIALSWGFPENLGVIEVLSLKGDAALDRVGHYGFENVHAPNEEKFKGVRLFGPMQLSNLPTAIDALFD